MNRMRKNKCGSIGYAFGVRGSTSVHLAMTEEIVNYQISLKCYVIFTSTIFQNAISKFTNFSWIFPKRSETYRNFVLKLSLGTSCHFKNLKTFYLYSHYRSRSIFALHRSSKSFIQSSFCLCPQVTFSWGGAKWQANWNLLYFLLKPNITRRISILLAMSASGRIKYLGNHLRGIMSMWVHADNVTDFKLDG